MAKQLMPIATLTLNPCLDVSYEFPRLVADQKVRAEATRFDPGGNGLNVGRALKRLGVSATNCCILAGEIGNLVQRLVERQLDDLQAVSVAGESRINCTILEKHPRAQYEVDGIGPEVDREAMRRIASLFLDAAQGGLGVVTGSLPAGVAPDTYGRLVESLGQRQARAVVDAHGPALEKALALRPFLIKPNRYELEMLCGRRLPDLAAVAEEGRRLQEQGVEYVCVSLGPEGALIAGPDSLYHASAPKVRIRSTVGAGDSLVAGLVAAFAQGQNAAQALKLAVACGAGTVQKPGTDLFARREVEESLDLIEVERLDT